MEYVKWAAKAITAFITAGLAAVVTYNLELPPWVLVLASSVVAALAVFLVPNGETPSR
jgi:hypothetical protein